MSPSEIKDRTDKVNEIVKSSAKRPVATRPLMDRGRCTCADCSKCRQAR